MTLWHHLMLADFYIGVRETLTVLVNSSNSRSSQGNFEIDIYAEIGIMYSTCLARGNSKKML
jgi:hypothetical protein